MRIYVKNLIEFKDNTSNFTFAIKDFNILTGKTGKKFMKLTLFDKTGEIDARFFEGFEGLENILKEGEIYSFKARPEVYNNQLYLKVFKIEAAKEYNLSDFIQTSEVPLQFMWEEFLQWIGTVTSKHWKELLDTFLNDREMIEKFKIWPAAKDWHHSYLHGLLEHTLGVIRLCDKVSILYKNLDRELLLVGAIFHDIGKLEEYEIKKTAVVITTPGRLLGHITIGCSIVENIIKRLKDFPLKDKEALLHLIVSHHGRYDWGSPKLPQFKEALILHWCDYLDSQITGMEQLYQRFHGREWTDYNKFLERHIYRYNLNDWEALPVDD